MAIVRSLSQYLMFFKSYENYMSSFRDFKLLPLTFDCSATFLLIKEGNLLFFCIYGGSCLNRCLKNAISSQNIIIPQPYGKKKKLSKQFCKFTKKGKDKVLATIPMIYSLSL